MAMVRTDSGRALGTRTARAASNPILSRRLVLELSLREVSMRMAEYGCPTHPSTLADYESGLYIPARPRLRALARVLGIEFAALEDQLLEVLPPDSSRGPHAA